MTKPHAGNTGRHEDYIATASASSGLWDRLRADLANLGAQYGELPTTCWPTVTITGEQALERWPEAVIPAGETVTQASIQMAMNKLWLDYLNGIGGSEIAAPEPQLTQPDLNLYYDGIILAARKKREAQNALGPSKACVFMQATDVGGLGHPLSQAMSRPLSFPKRIGWKPGDCE